MKPTTQKGDDVTVLGETLIDNSVGHMFDEFFQRGGVMLGQENLLAKMKF